MDFLLGAVYDSSCDPQVADSHPKVQDLRNLKPCRL